MQLKFLTAAEACIGNDLSEWENLGMTQGYSGKLNEWSSAARADPLLSVDA